MENKFLVGMAGDEAIIIKPINRLSKDDAINLMAWLIVLLDIEPDELITEVQKVQNT